MVIIRILLERSFRGSFGAVMHCRIHRAAHFLLGSLIARVHPRSFGLADFTSLLRDRRKSFVHSAGKVTTWLRTDRWWWSSSLLCLLHFKSSLLNGLSRSSLLSIRNGICPLTLLLDFALPISFISALLLFLSSLFLLDGGPLSLDFLLSLTFSLCSQLVL